MWKIKVVLKMHLFSHKFQKPAIWTFILCQVVVFIFFFVRTFIDPETAFNPFPDNVALFRIALFLYVLAVYGSLFFMIFSKEKVEDEYISKIRLESVAVVAAVIICISFVLLLIQCAQPLDSYREFRQMVRDLFAGFIYWAPIVYICVFKYKLRHQA